MVTLGRPGWRPPFSDLIAYLRCWVLFGLLGLPWVGGWGRGGRSPTTLLGLVKHVTYVEHVWFNQALTGTGLKDLGAPSTPDRSVILRKTDTIETVRAAYVAACAESRRLAAGLALDQEVTGRGPRALWAIYAHMLRELAQHCGHADILREQVIAARADQAGRAESGVPR